MDRAAWLAAFADELGRHTGLPAENFAATAEERFLADGAADPVELARESIDDWNNEGENFERTGAGEFLMGWLDAQHRAELIACIEAGAAARLAGADHGDNPNLVTLAGLSPEQASRVVQRCEAWWDGFEEVHLALLGPARSPYRGKSIPF